VGRFSAALIIMLAMRIQRPYFRRQPVHWRLFTAGSVVVVAMQLYFPLSATSLKFVSPSFLSSASSR
jgi:hypothetical protein